MRLAKTVTASKGRSVLIRAATGTIFLLAVASAVGQTYHIQELPPLYPSQHSYGAGVNNNGAVVGAGYVSATVSHALMWVNGTPVDLEPLPSNVHSYALAVSNPNVSEDVIAVGRSSNWDPCAEGTSPTCWYDGLPYILDKPPRRWVDVWGVMPARVGFVMVGEGLDSCDPPWRDMAYRWTSGGGPPTELVPLPGDPESGAYDICNNRVVGFSGSSDGPSPHLRACRWDILDPAALPDLGGDHSIAFGINDSGQFAGYSRTPDGKFRAYLFDGNNAIDLGTKMGWPHSAATRLNNAGTVIGYAFDNNTDTFWPYGFNSSGQRGLVWRDGVLRDINNLIPPGSGWTVGGLRDINERGQIVGTGWLNGRLRACLLTPAYGDLNCDSAVNFADINPFVLALSNPEEYGRQYPECDIMNADCNSDGFVDFGDINPFVLLLSGSVGYSPRPV